MTPNQQKKQYKLDCLAQDGLGDDIEYASPEVKDDQYLFELKYLVKYFRNINKRLLNK